MADLVLDVQKLSAGYGGLPIVQDVDVQAKKGEVTVIVGLNGSGKSTLLKAIAGVLTPISGKVVLGGMDLRGKPPEDILRKGISYVPQLDNVFPSLSVRENLEMGAYILRSGVRKKIDEICDLFPDLKDALKRPARTLSGGQRHMLAVARGLMVQPQVLLLDEPTAGLAPLVEVSVWENILTIRSTGVALLIVDQNVRRALSNADWAYVMSLGRNHLSGSGSELLRSDEVGALYAAVTEDSRSP
ncbi:MAG: ABC transporter ATP-binding protein [Candidatus Dormibacteria bacterium]